MRKEDLNFYIGEYLTSRIPTLFLAREMFWDEYSDFTYKDLSEAALGRELQLSTLEEVFQMKDLI